jgi:hypothetical protein
MIGIITHRTSTTSTFTIVPAHQLSSQQLLTVEHYAQAYMVIAIIAMVGGWVGGLALERS